MNRVVRLQIRSHPYFIMNILTGEPMNHVETLSTETTLSMRRKVLQIIEVSVCSSACRLSNAATVGALPFLLQRSTSTSVASGL